MELQKQIKYYEACLVEMKSHGLINNAYYSMVGVLYKLYLDDDQVDMAEKALVDNLVDKDGIVINFGTYLESKFSLLNYLIYTDAGDAKLQEQIDIIKPVLDPKSKPLLPMYAKLLGYEAIISDNKEDAEAKLTEALRITSETVGGYSYDFVQLRVLGYRVFEKHYHDNGDYKQYITYCVDTLQYMNKLKDESSTGIYFRGLMYNNLAEALFDGGEYKEALEMLKKAIILKEFNLNNVKAEDRQAAIDSYSYSKGRLKEFEGKVGD
jgi:tetratricopeptide (TPR) repeat protein